MPTDCGDPFLMSRNAICSALPVEPFHFYCLANALFQLMNVAVPMQLAWWQDRMQKTRPPQKKKKWEPQIVQYSRWGDVRAEGQKANRHTQPSRFALIVGWGVVVSVGYKFRLMVNWNVNQIPFSLGSDDAEMPKESSLSQTRGNMPFRILIKSINLNAECGNGNYKLLNIEVAPASGHFPFFHYLYLPKFEFFTFLCLSAGLVLVHLSNMM